jgi:hypothetical protein
MGTMVVTENQTLDGVIEQVGDWFVPASGDADDADYATWCAVAGSSPSNAAESNATTFPISIHVAID